MFPIFNQEDNTMMIIIIACEFSVNSICCDQTPVVSTSKAIENVGSDFTLLDIVCTFRAKYF